MFIHWEWMVKKCWFNFIANLIIIFGLRNIFNKIFVTLQPFKTDQNSDFL